MTKRFLALLLTLAMLTMLIPAAFAQEVSHMLPGVEITGYGSGSGELPGDLIAFPKAASPMSSGQYRVTQKSGNYENWIDRVTVSEIGRRLYDILVEGADGDGDRDYLIEDRYYDLSGATADPTSVAIGDHLVLQLNDGRASCVKLGVVHATKAEIDSCETAVSALNYEVNSIAVATVAFDRDHPEVFWINNGYNYFYYYTGNDTKGYEVHLFYGLKSSDGNQIDLRRSQFPSQSAVKSAVDRMNGNVAAIKAGVPANASTYEKLAYYNQWLVAHNQYSTQPDLYDDDVCPWDMREPSNALEGKSGLAGPVCESYARAVKVLCDTENIPCVLVKGDAVTWPGATPEGHMWNYVKVDGAWYAVDVTWNDGGDLGGPNHDAWLLVGGDTVLYDLRFTQSHPPTNQEPIMNYDILFTNGPVLSSEKYTVKLGLSYTDMPETLTIGTAMPTLAPVISNGGASSGYVYSADGALPAGITLNRDGTITGTPTAASKEPLAVTITTSGSAGTASCTLTFPSVQKMANSVTFSNPTATFTGNGSEAPEVSFAAAAASGGEICYEYKARDAADTAYTAAVPTAAGLYTVRATAAETDTYQAAFATFDFEIVLRGGDSQSDPDSDSEDGEKRPDGSEGTEIQVMPEIKGDTATITLTREAGTKMVDQARVENASQVKITAEVPASVRKMVIVLPADVVRDLDRKTTAGIRVDLKVASVTLPKGSLKDLSGDSGSLLITVERAEETFSLKLALNGRTVNALQRGVTLLVAYPGCTLGTVAMLKQSDGTMEVLRTSLAKPEAGTVNIPMRGSGTVWLTDQSLSFEDVHEKDWFVDCVAFASSHQLMIGVDDRHFKPLDQTTRGSFITILYHLDDNPVVGDPYYADTAAGVWYTDAVTWSALNHIAEGLDEDNFGPEDQITREQMVMMLYNYAEYRGADVSARADLGGFADAGNISENALAAMQWAVAEDLVHGVGNNMLAPLDSATRSEVSALLMHYCEILAR